MKTKLLLIALLSLFQIPSQQVNKTTSQQDVLWKEVNKNLEDKLPETAETFLNIIEQKAIEENNQKELLKTFLYRFKIFSLKDENPIESSITFAEENISRLQEPERAIFNIAIASLYENLKPDAKSQKADAQSQYYEAALADIKSLQDNTTESYRDILAINNENATFNFNIEPTLYDYVVHKIIRQQVNETTSQRVTELYQNLIDFNEKNNYTDAAIYNEIHKLKYEYETSDDFETYYNSLEEIKNENIDNPLVTSVMALQAEAIFSQRVETFQEPETKILNICNEAIKLFPNSEGAKECKSIRSEILRKELTLSMQNVALPNHSISAKITYRNLTNPHYRIYKVNDDELENLRNKNNQEAIKELLKKNYIVENHINIIDKKDYIEHSLNINLPELDCGTYYVMFSKDDKFSKDEDKLPALHSFQVSKLSYVTMKENNDFVIYVLDRENGKPVKDVNVNIYKDNYDYKQRRYVKNNLQNLVTDKNGKATISKQNHSFQIDLYKGDDKLLSDTYFHNYQDRSEDILREKTYFFTDRAIYRPGQTVYYKGIILNENTEKKELLVGKETTVTLKDSNWQDITTQTLTTNDFASFDGSFVIPNNVSNGYFQIKNESGSIGFRVEEYKRPTFEIIFNDIDKSFKLNDSIHIEASAKSYAGFGLDNVNYNYTIIRRAYFPYRYWWSANYRDNEKQIAFGDGKTDKEGNLNIDFKLIPDKNDKNKLPVYEYIVTVNITNVQGETQSKTFTLKASEIDMIIDIDDDNTIINKDNLSEATFTVKNIKENPVEAIILRRIYKASSQLIYEDTINVNGNYGLFQDVNKNLEVGRYVVELISANNEKAKISKEVTIIDLDNKKMPYDTICFSYYDKTSAQPNEYVNFYLGSSAKDVIVHLFIKHGDELRYSERKTFSDEVLKISYKIKEEDRGEISFQAFFVKDNTINIVNQNVAVPYDNLKLDIRLDVERDDLLPGAEERWNLTITDADSYGVIANVLASMYDASLDAFAKNHWYFNTSPDIKIAERPRSDRSFDSFSCSAYNKYYERYDLFSYYLPSDAALTPFMRYYKTISARDIMMMSKNERSAIAVSVGGVNNKAATTDDDSSEYEFAITEEMIETSLTDESSTEALPLLRENFNETAFFYPNLKTNDDGSLTLSFTMPNALTRWNLMMMAYTKDLKTGTLNKTFTTSKPLMIMSDMPRFCYENDTLWMVANVVKTQSDSVKSATAKLEIFDALTMKPLDLILSEQEINIDDISEGSSKSVRWKVVVNAETDADLLAFRFSVSCDNFSDAEQHLLPIISDEVFMTETYPLTIEPHSSRTFDFDFNNENERNQGVTLNYCSDPIWYAIQALPYLSQETGDNIDVAFNVFYANSLASYIAHNIPNLLNYIKKWKIESPDVLMSQLQKDENLKAIMLQETPWVLEAKSETEQKAKIANLFDINTLRHKTDEALNLLKEKQSVNGGWSWMPNMPESPFITQYILSGLGRLHKMNVINSLTTEQQNKVNDISQKAIKYLCNEIVEDYDMTKEISKKASYSLSYNTINKLYALSFYDFKEESDYNKAKDFMIDRLQKDWRDFDFEVQAKIALVMYRSGDTNTSLLIMKSLKERMSQVSSSTDVSEQAMIMEVFREINPDKDILNAMMIGLLNNKRTNMWENAIMTVDATYAILETMRQQNDEITSQQSVFIQRYWSAEELKDFKDFTIENPNNNITWGGLFRQYFVSIDEVRRHESQLNIERALFVERIDENGKYLIPIEDFKDSTSHIRIGDKVTVNITIEASQDMEFVFLKDLRAACFEPTQQMSRYNYSDGLSYYQSNSDTFMGFYFDRLPKGKHQVSYSMFVTKEGSFSNGYALIQCMYAPEFSAYSEGMRIEIK